MPKKRSEEGSIIAYFSMRPLDIAESLLAILNELVRTRRKEGQPKVRKVKAVATPPAPDSKPG